MDDLTDDRLLRIARVRSESPWMSRLEEFDDIEAMVDELRRNRATLARIETWATGLATVGDLGQAIAEDLRKNMKGDSDG